MPNWIEDAANRAVKEKERRNAADAARQAIAAARQAAGPAIFESLRQALEKDVALFNQHFPEAMKVLKVESVGEHNFQIRRPYPPEFLLSLTLERSLTSISWTIKDHRGMNGGSYSTYHDVGTGESGLYLNEQHTNPMLTVEEASRMLLLPVVESTA